MILTLHTLVGAIISLYFRPLWIGILLAFLSHYFLDFLPHKDYSIKNIKQKNWGKAFFDFGKIFLDGIGGFLILALCLKKPWIGFLGGGISLIPDGIHFLNIFFNNQKIICGLEKFHQRIHFPYSNQIPSFLNLIVQSSLILMSVSLLLQLQTHP